jgi:hypothetical protein
MGVVRSEYMRDALIHGYERRFGSVPSVSTREDGTLARSADVLVARALQSMEKIAVPAVLQEVIN